MNSASGFSKHSWAGLDLNTELWMKHFCNKDQVCLISQYCKEVLMEGKQISNSFHWGSLVIHILGILSKSGCTCTWVSVDVWLYVYFDFFWSLVLHILWFLLKSGFTCTWTSVEVWFYIKMLGFLLYFVIILIWSIILTFRKIFSHFIVDKCCLDNLTVMGNRKSIWINIVCNVISLLDANLYGYKCLPGR